MADTVPEEIVDVGFRLAGGRIPVDHAYALFRNISDALPWFADDEAASLQQIHTAATGSGWIRPDSSPAGELHLSRRTRLVLRVPAGRIEAALALSGREMDMGGDPVTPGAGKVAPLVPASTLLARHVTCEEGEEESRLGERLTQTLGESGVCGASLVFGRAARITTPEYVLHTRSVVVTHLDREGAMTLLRHGVGTAGKLGCGVFVPYKRID